VVSEERRPAVGIGRIPCAAGAERVLVFAASRRVGVDEGTDDVVEQMIDDRVGGGEAAGVA